MVPELLYHLFDREKTPDNRVAYELHAEFSQIVHLGVDDAVGESEVGYAVPEHAARLMKGLEDGDLAPRFCHVRGAGDARRSRPDDRDAEAVTLDVRNVGPAFGNREIADEPLETPDGHRRQGVSHRAHAFALVLLRTDASANRGKQVGPRDDVVGAAVVLLGNSHDELGDVDRDRTPRNANRVRAVEASLRFQQSLLFGVPQTDFVEIAHAFGGRLLGAGVRSCGMVRIVFFGIVLLLEPEQWARRSPGNGSGFLHARHAASVRPTSPPPLFPLR